MKFTSKPSPRGVLSMILSCQMILHFGVTLPMNGVKVLDIKIECRLVQQTGFKHLYIQNMQIK